MQPLESQQSVSVVENVAPPQPMREKKKAGKWIPIIVLLLLVGAAGGWFFIASQKSKEQPTPSPVPFVEPAATEAPEPTATPKAVDKKSIKIQVLNGTGTPGEAAYLQGVLKSLGYSNITVGNSTQQDVTTTKVVFSTSLSKEVTQEITDKLKETYKSVEIKTSSTDKDFDIEITTGLRKNQTARPASTATPKVSGSPTGTPKATATSTPTPTATP